MDLLRIAARVAAGEVNVPDSMGDSASDEAGQVQSTVNRLTAALREHLDSGESLESFEQDGYAALDGDITLGVDADPNSAAPGEIVAMGLEDGEVNDDPFYRAPPEEFSAEACVRAWEGWKADRAAEQEMLEEGEDPGPPSEGGPPWDTLEEKRGDK